MGCRKTGWLAQGHAGTLWQRGETTCPEGQVLSMKHKIPFPLLPAKPHAPSGSQHQSHFQPYRSSKYPKQESLRSSALCSSAAKSQSTDNPLFSCSPPARPPAPAGHRSAVRSSTQLDFHGIYLNSGEAGISQSYRGRFKVFQILSFFTQSAILLPGFLKNDTQLCFGSQLCLLAAGGGGPVLGWGSRVTPSRPASSPRGRVQPCGSCCITAFLSY